jgi:hypothetical protein
MEQAADRLGISTTAVRHMIERKVITATQIVPCAPWEIAPEALETETVRAAVEAIKRGQTLSRVRGSLEDRSLTFEFGSAD